MIRWLYLLILLGPSLAADEDEKTRAALKKFRRMLDSGEEEALEVLPLPEIIDAIPAP